VLIAAFASSAAVLLVVALLPRFWIAITLLTAWGLLFAVVMPVRQAYINEQIPSAERATVLSFNSLVGSAGGVAFQPLLGRAADVWGYPMSYACSAAIQAVSVPFGWLARRQRAKSDAIT
jgi:MFS family permease